MLLFALSLTGLSAITGSAGQVGWVGGTTGDFGNASNWADLSTYVQRVPGTADTVIPYVPSGSQVVVGISANTSVGAIQTALAANKVFIFNIGSAYTLNLVSTGPTLFTSGSGTLLQFADGSISSAGQFQIRDSSTLEFDGTDVTLTGTGSDGTVFVGINSGEASLSLANQASLHAEGLEVGSYGQGRFTISGSSSLSVADLAIGNSYTGIGQVSSGSIDVSGQSFIGLKGTAGPAGTLQLTGEDALFRASDIVAVGNGTFEIKNGASAAIASALDVGGMLLTSGPVAGNGLVVVDGSGSSLSADSLVLGDIGTGHVQIVNGGRLSVGKLEIGFNDGTGDLQVRGDESSVQITGNATFRQGEFRVSDGASIASDLDFKVMPDQGGSARLSVSEGYATFSAGLSLAGQGDASIDVNSGGFVSVNALLTGDSDGGRGRASISGSGSALAAGQGLIYSGSSVSVRDGGTLYILGGVLFVEEGGLLTMDQGRISGGGGLFGTPLVVGSVSGAGRIEDLVFSGHIETGAERGILEFSNVTFATGSSLTLMIAGSGIDQYDSVLFGDNVDVSNLNVSIIFSDTFLPSNGDAFHLFDGRWDLAAFGEYSVPQNWSLTSDGFLVAIPESSTFALVAALGALAATFLRRCRRNASGSKA